MIVDRRLFLLRHCQSAVDSTRDPSTWGLTPTGFDDAQRLARSPLLVDASIVAAGDEPKMVETVQPLADQLAINVTVSPRLAESGSGGWVSDEEFEPLVRRLLEDPDRAPAVGWESATATADRILAEIDDIAAGRPTGDIVVCTGGRAITASLIGLRLLDPIDALESWRALQMPDVVVVQFDRHGEASL